MQNNIIYNCNNIINNGICVHDGKHISVFGITCVDNFIFPRFFDPTTYPSIDMLAFN